MLALKLCTKNKTDDKTHKIEFSDVLKAENTQDIHETSKRLNKHVLLLIDCTENAQVMPKIYSNDDLLGVVNYAFETLHKLGHGVKDSTNIYKQIENKLKV